jgi:hypothetical protein
VGEETARSRVNATSRLGDDWREGTGVGQDGVELTERQVLEGGSEVNEAEEEGEDERASSQRQQG